jgi:predicted Rossmann-fold nucleotide-binding protein
MTGFNDTEFELIFDTVAKSAIMRRGDSLIWLPGPFGTYPEAMQAARLRIADIDGKPSSRR